MTTEPSRKESAKMPYAKPLLTTFEFQFKVKQTDVRERMKALGEREKRCLEIKSTKRKNQPAPHAYGAQHSMPNVVQFASLAPISISLSLAPHSCFRHYTVALL